MTASSTVSPDVLADIVKAALDRADLPPADVRFERPRNPEHGDWSTNVALTLSKAAGKPPRVVAEQIVESLGAPDGIAEITVAGPGFINFRLAQDALTEVVKSVIAAGEKRWGRCDIAEGKTINVEFVSANPTGPLHVGHGRWVALGDAISNVLEAVGWTVVREYYLNDAGNQVNTFRDSVRAKMKNEPLPEDGYKGAYIGEVAETLASQGIDPEDLDAVREAALTAMTAQIRHTMETIGIDIDVWLSEKSLHDSGAIDNTLNELAEQNIVYQSEGATWIRTTDFGDDKDRVVIKDDGVKTYFAADVAYLGNKFDRGCDHAIYLLGADHHGYVGRLMAIAAAEGKGGQVEVIIGQLVNLLRNGAPVRMGKRSGNFVTLDELVDEVGADATRYTFLRSSSDTPMDFDIAKVVSDDKANPVHYINYSYARIAGIARKAEEVGFEPTPLDDTDLSLLTHPTEIELIRKMDAFGEVVLKAATDRAPHRVARYAEELADIFHRFYTECHVIGDDPAVSSARYWLCEAVRVCVGAALGIVGVTPRDRM